MINQTSSITRRHEGHNHPRTKMLFESADDLSGIGHLELIEPTDDDRLRQRMCERKKRYDRRGAQTVINAFAKQRGRHGRPENLRAYPCLFCAAWHLTKAETVSL